MNTEPELCPLCGSSDVVAGDCNTCAEIREEEDRCSRCGDDLADGDCPTCEEIAAEIAAEEAAENCPQDDAP